MSLQLKSVCSSGLCVVIHAGLSATPREGIQTQNTNKPDELQELRKRVFCAAIATQTSGRIRKVKPPILDSNSPMVKIVEVGSTVWIRPGV